MVGSLSRKISTFLKQQLFQFNYYRVHLIYFVLSILIWSAIFYASNGETHISYTDALTLSTSAITNTGLTVVDLSALTAWQQAILCILMLAGDLSLVSVSVVIARRYFFGRKIRDFVTKSEAGKWVAADIEENRAARHLRSRSRPDAERTTAEHVAAMRHRGSPHLGPLSAEKKDPPRHPSHVTGYGGFPAPWDYFFKRARRHGFSKSDKEVPRPEDHHYLSFSPTLDSKGRFTNMTAEQAREIGGVEYRALILLSWLLPMYVFVWLAFITVILVPYSTRASTRATITSSQPGRLRPEWWAFFATVSSYTNNGLNLLDLNMIPFARDYLILIISGTAIVAGNMFYPIFLRLAIWILSRLVPRNTEIHHSLSFLLQHPRRCYYFLFPSKNTWYLVAIQAGVTIASWVLFEVLNINFRHIDPGVPVGQRIMNGLYMANGLRASGAYTMLVSDLAPAVQILYLSVMYLSAFPFIMSVRRTNIYEERSLGLTEQLSKATGSKPSSLGIHIRNQLAYDLWWVILAVFFISIIERTQLALPSPGFNLFSVIFEVISAYGTVGFSLGLPDDNYSFCGAWHTLSKLILITVMLRGRHRILPIAIDHSVLIPGSGLMEKLDKKYRRRGHIDQEEWERDKAEILEGQEGAQAERGGAQQGPKKRAEHGGVQQDPRVRGRRRERQHSERDHEESLRQRSERDHEKREN